jgi:hypothetical protein
MDLENTEFPGAVPGSGQELNSITHPHLMLDKGGMVSMRPVKPGDMVLWHCGEFATLLVRVSVLSCRVMNRWNPFSRV